MANATFTGVATTVSKPKRVFLMAQLWDIAGWHGFLMPRQGAFLLRVPSSLHEINSGVFSSKGLREVATRHAAGGVYPLVHFNAPQPAITDISASSGVISVEWDRHKPGTTYNIYSMLKNPAEYPDEKWKLMASGIIENDTGTNSGSFTCLQSGVLNYVYVEARDPSGNNHTMPSVYEVIKYVRILVPAE